MDLEEQLKNWQERMKEKEKKEKEEEEQRLNKLRQNYLTRTGRKEMKP